MLFRFAQGSIHRHGVFNGDPHPGNYRFHADGSVTFLDFGLVKRWTAGELGAAVAVPRRDRWRTIRRPLVAAMVEAGFLPPDHGLDPQRGLRVRERAVRAVPARHVHLHAEFIGEALGTVVDINGPYAEVIRRLNMPASFVILDRVVWGVDALLGKLDTTGPWRGILDEYRHGARPATPLGELEARWAR